MSSVALEWAHGALARTRSRVGPIPARFLLTLAEAADRRGVCRAPVDRLLLRSGLSLAQARLSWACLADARLAAAGPETLPDGPCALPLTFVLAMEAAQVVPLRR